MTRTELDKMLVENGNCKTVIERKTGKPYLKIKKASSLRELEDSLPRGVKVTSFWGNVVEINGVTWICRK